MTRPLIGLTTYAPDTDDRFATPRKYVDAVRRAGGIVVLVPPGADDVTEVLEHLDGCLFIGGGDIDPSRYGATVHDHTYGVNEERDESELALATAVIARDFPTLAICRGSQVINVALGGTLHQHLPDVVGLDLAHRADPPGPIKHPVTVEPGTMLAKAMGATEVHTMSFHHQAIDRPGEGLAVVARADDGTIEAVELADHPWLLVVQWHPELTADEDPTQQALFDELVRQAAERSR